jgi:hypothetical protein
MEKEKRRQVTKKGGWRKSRDRETLRRPLFYDFFFALYRGVPLYVYSGTTVKSISLCWHSVWAGRGEATRLNRTVTSGRIRDREPLARAVYRSSRPIGMGRLKRGGVSKTTNKWVR